MDEDLDLIPEDSPEEDGLSGELVDPNDISTQLTSKLDGDVVIKEQQRGDLRKYMEKMRWGITGVSPLTCLDEDCPYFSKCPLVRANIPRPKDKDCPVEQALMDQWLHQFLEASGCALDQLSAYDMLIIQDIAYQQLLEARAAMELADNPQIQVRTFVGTDPKDGSPMYTYTLNNLVTFREKSNKLKMKLLREMIATAKAKSEEDRGQRDRSSETAERLRRIEDKLGKDAIHVIDADFEATDD